MEAPIQCLGPRTEASFLNRSVLKAYMKPDVTELSCST